MAERDKNIYFARLAEQGERYEDMIRYMKEVVKVSYLQGYKWKSFWLYWKLNWFVGFRKDNFQMTKEIC